MTVHSEIQSLSPSTLIELFKLDLSLQGGPVLYFHAGTNGMQGQSMTFELASSLDMVAVRLPRRQYIQNCCTWLYRGADCGYSGGPVADAGGNPTTNPTLDACGKQLSDCKLRFGANAVLPFGGFPGCGLTT